MGVENRIKFETNWEDRKKNGICAYMLFLVSSFDGETYEEKVEVDCYEDIEMYFKMYFKDNWKELFEGRDIYTAEFKGFRFVGKNEFATLNLDIENRTEARVHVNPEKLKDRNANIVAEIRNLVNS